MDGVLEATITLFGCKVLCSLLCLPTFKRSMSSVGLCCSCLLFFTDLSITVFLAYLWCGGPRLASFQPSSDIIALRFGLFLGHTYGAVLLLTPPLVTVEVLTRFLWPREETVEVSVEGQAVEEKDACPGASALLTVVGGEPWEEGVTGVESGRGLKAVGFLGCLLLWGMCGTFAGSSWTQTLPAVRACLEGGSSLSTCLPCLITTSSPITEELAWALPTAALLLGLAPGVGLLTARLACTFVQAEEHVCAEQREDTPVFQPVLRRPPESAGDSDEAADTCDIRSSHPAHNSRQQPSGKPVLAPGQTGSADARKLKSESMSLPPQMRCDLPVDGTVQAPPSCERWAWQAQGESPSPRTGMMMGLACAFLVCLCPTVLSTNIALISSLDTLAVYVVQQLWTPTHNT